MRNCTDDLSHFFLSAGVGLGLGHFFLIAKKIVSAVLDFDPRFVLGDHYILGDHIISDYFGK